jgi:class 3 adenylate cyclase
MTAAWIGIAAGVAAIAGAIVAATRAIVRAPLDVEHERLEASKSEVEQALDREREGLADLNARHHTLQRDFRHLKEGKTSVLLKHEIDTQLREAMEILDVTESSILVPGPQRGSSTFVFLCINGPAAARLRMAKLPIDKGIVGRVFATGTPHNTADAYRDPNFFVDIDKRGAHETRALLTLPLRHNGHIIGVMQFLNKASGFSTEDEIEATALADSIAAKVDAFVCDVENFELLGLAWRSADKEATIAFCDLTASSSLLAHMNIPSAVDCINEYLEQQCEIAMKRGATVDKFIGDAAMLSFNVPRLITTGDHVVRAVEAALEMRDVFSDLKETWLTASLPVDSVYSRIGLSCGPVYEARIGHPHLQQPTLIGEAVHEAANLCEKAARDRNTVLVDERVLRRLQGRFVVRRPLVSRRGERAYEILEPR